MAVVRGHVRHTKLGATAVRAHTRKTKQSRHQIMLGDNGKYYKVKNETWYHIETSDDMVDLLERLRQNQTRVRFHWGDTKTGKDWGDVYDVAGTIGRSTGSVKIPLLIQTGRSYGGGGILTHCIVKIRYANQKEGGIIYQHPKYHV